MKRTNLGLALVTAFVVSSFGVRTQADEVTTSLKDQAGITPGSILYPVDKAIDEIKIALSFTDGSKIESITKVAEERLGESEVMQEVGKTAEAAKVLKEANEKMEEAARKAKETVGKTKDVEAEAKITKVEKTLENLAKKQATFETVLKKLEEKSSGELKEKLQEVMDKNAERKLSVASMVDSRHSLNDARKALKEAENSGDATKIAQVKIVYEQAKTDFTKVFNSKQEVVNKNEKGQKEAEKEKKQEKAVDSKGAAAEAKQGTEAKQASEVKQGSEVKDDKKAEQQSSENKDKEKSNNGQNGAQDKKDSTQDKGKKDK
jgi:hypothetical protein